MCISLTFKEPYCEMKYSIRMYTQIITTFDYIFSLITMNCMQARKIRISARKQNMEFFCQERVENLVTVTL